MTQRRNDPDRLSNHFDSLYRDIGHRGSSFTDLDAITHDARTGRFLVQEFKWLGEPSLPGQRRLLLALADLPNFTVWVCVKRSDDASYAWADYRRLDSIDVVTADEMRRRFEAWWNNAYCLDAYLVTGAMAR